MRRLNPFVIFLLFLVTGTLACVVPGLSITPTPPPSPTPLGDTIFFSAPYAISLSETTAIPGTSIRYVQQIGDLHEFNIDGLQAYRQAGDSLTWRGVVAPGVFGDYRLRLQRDFSGRLQADGDVHLAIFNPTAVEIPPTQTPLGSVHYEGISTQYFVPEGRRIPGTTLVYEGQQNQIAELSGTVGYPYFAQDDSLFWLGKLRENVYIRYDLKVESLSDAGLGLSGSAELWVTE
jgi:hypothetical protein